MALIVSAIVQKYWLNVLPTMLGSEETELPTRREIGEDRKEPVDMIVVDMISGQTCPVGVWFSPRLSGSSFSLFESCVGPGLD